MKYRCFLMVILIFVLGILICLPLQASNIAEKDQPVVVVSVKGAIFSSTAKYIERGIEESEKNGAICIIELDTPGGLIKSMREIIQKISSSSVPVVVYVYPHGAMATSAGTYIVYSAHVAAMAPGTHIGSAHPVSIGYDTKRKKDLPAPKGQKKTKEKSKDTSKEVNVGMEKATNAMVALIRSLAEKNNRNADWGEKAVRQSVSITAKKALKLKVVEIVAENIPDLLEKLKGRKVTLMGKKTVTLRPSQSDIKYVRMTKIEKFLLTLNDPQIAIILLLMGGAGIYYELVNPGATIPAVIGGICLILGLYTMGSLPINYAAFGLIILSIIFFIAEALTPTHGVLSVGGTIAFILGAVFLVPANIPFIRISKSFIIFMGILMGSFTFIIVTLVAKSFTAKVQTGSQGIINQTATVKTSLKPQGLVLMEGEIWKAKTSGDIIPTGRKVVVDKIEGLLLTVHEKQDED